MSRGVPFRWSKAVPRAEYDRPTARVARDLLGNVLARRYDGTFRLGRIVETEAYLGFNDPASHVANGFTDRTEGIWGCPGKAYVFLAYGLHRCFNVITLSREPYGGVLIRGIEPLWVEDGRARPSGGRIRDGPGKVSQYLRIGLVHSGTDLVRGDIRILRDGYEPTRVYATPRVGITKAAHRRLRFVARGFRDG